MDSHLFFTGGEWILINSLGGGGTWKIKKGGGSMVQWQLFLKAGAGTFAIKFFKGWTFLHLEIILLCKTALYIWRTNIFLCQHNLMKKVILSYLKMSLCVCVRKVNMSVLGRRGGIVSVCRWRELSKIL